ncbi:hypothetical protein [Haloactinomyces albus]|uniref:Uncharacterized protein n=1 Tax=Haloactinomyces albus TaxID=1352928 RepID=A0AAE3Z7U2_9ACTN|nr:hypothetical protein [Haloactinomyces albus]MDR7299913.1 hypothetical protein [Haloactinomyces albus]
MISHDHEAAPRRHSAAEAAGTMPASPLVPTQARPAHHSAEHTFAPDRDETEESHLVRGYD